MIIVKGKQAQMHLGNGDISVANGCVSFCGDSKKYGVVSFTNQHPGEVGAVTAIRFGEINLQECDVYMAFSNTASIDIVINMLISAKTDMEARG